VSTEADRPWVGLETIIPKKFSAGRKIEVWAYIRNSGRSPAIKMQVRFLGYVLPDGQVYPVHPNPSDQPTKLLIPSVIDRYPPFHEKAVSAAEFRGIGKGKLVVWIVGCIKYLDGAGKRHTTRVCVRWDRIRREFVPHEAGNDAD